MTNNMTNVVYFQPAQPTFAEREPLNILLVADSSAAGKCTFHFYASDGNTRREIFSQEKTVEKGHTHLYFQLPARCFGAETWGEVPDELTLLAATAPPENADGGILLFRA